MRRHIPNILTVGRVGLSLVSFGCLCGAVWQGRNAFGISVAGVDPGVHALLGWAFVTFTVAAVTDFLDGWLARRWGVVSTFGAILDPIGDKILVCGALVGLVALQPVLEVVLPAGLILMREFSVSALREVLAPRGLKLPVTFLAKTKTALQLAAIALLLGLLGLAVPALSVSRPLAHLMMDALPFATGLLWLAAAVTVWTGAEYGIAAYRKLRAA